MSVFHLDDLTSKTARKNFLTFASDGNGVEIWAGGRTEQASRNEALAAYRVAAAFADDKEDDR